MWFQKYKGVKKIKVVFFPKNNEKYDTGFWKLVEFNVQNSLCSYMSMHNYSQVLALLWYC